MSSAAACPSTPLRRWYKYSKDHPDTLNYGSVGVGSAAHLVIEWLRKTSGGDWKHVPFNGAPQVQAAIASGDVHLTFTPSGNVMGRIASGDLKALLTAGETRNPLLPDVPTFVEAGLPSLPAKSWAGLFVPVGTPAERDCATSSRIHRDRQRAKLPSAASGQAWPGARSNGAWRSSRRFVAADQRAWEPLIGQSGIQPN